MLLKQMGRWNYFFIVLENITSWSYLFRSGLNDRMFIQICYSVGSPLTYRGSVFLKNHRKGGLKIGSNCFSLLIYEFCSSNAHINKYQTQLCISRKQLEKGELLYRRVVYTREGVQTFCIPHIWFSNLSLIHKLKF